MLSKRSLIVVFCGFLVAGLVGFHPSEVSAKPRVFGYAKPVLWVGLADPYKVRGIARLQLGVEGGEGGGLKYYGAFDMEVDDQLFYKVQDPAGRGGASFFPVEAYVSYSVGDLDLKVGKQFIFWGQAPWFSPTDVLCAWDYLNISSEIEDYRIAAWAIRAKMYFEAVTIDFVWIPLALPHRFGTGGMASSTGSSAGALPVQYKAYEPEGTIKESELALRLGFRFWGIDMHLIGYWGFEKYPSMTVKPQMDPKTGRPTAMLIQQSFERVFVGGLDLSRPFGKLMVKLEAAYNHTKDFEGKDPFISNSHVDWTICLEYSFSSKFSLTLQYTEIDRINYDEKAENEALKKAGSPITAPPTISRSVTVMIKWKMFARLSMQLTGMVSISQPSAFIMGFFDAELANALHLYVGAVGFVGPDDSEWGKMSSFSRAFLELKYAF